MTIPSFVLGIAGGTGAGKTTVAREVTAGLEGADSRTDRRVEPGEGFEEDQPDAEGSAGAVTHVPLDNYYEDRPELTLDEREEINYDHPSAFDWELLREHFDRLLSGQPIEMPQYDFETHSRTGERVRVEPTDVVVLEGILALHDEAIVDMLDLRLYVETDADVRILRRIRRDVLERGRSLEGVIDQYLSTVKPMHEQFVEPTKKEADLVIPEGANTVAIDLLEAAIAAARDRQLGGAPATEAEPGTPLLEYDD
ncbi:uridine kinase [Halalkalicoccus tibetensis]|uniref:Phosphopentokinase n=1 Tax=Halalkalicoccus tibetensis TaxID=175632 RepID=A0ABD5UYK6_9EURY